MAKHWLADHPGQDKPQFGMKVVRTHKSAFSRQVHEAILIEMADGQTGDSLLNSKGEFNRCELPRLTVQIGQRPWTDRQDVEEVTEMDEEQEVEASKDRKRLKGGQGGASQPPSKRRRKQHQVVRQDQQKRKREEEKVEETPSKRQKPPPPPPKETEREKEGTAPRRMTSGGKSSINFLEVNRKSKTKFQTIVQMFNNQKENPENFKPKFNFHLSPNPGSKTSNNSSLAPATDLDTHPAENFSHKSTIATTQQKQLKPENKANYHPNPAPHPPPHIKLNPRKKKVKPPHKAISQQITAFFPPKHQL